MQHLNRPDKYRSLIPHAERTERDFGVPDQDLITCNRKRLAQAIAAAPLVAIVAIAPKIASGDDNKDAPVEGGSAPDCKILSTVTVEEEEFHWTLVKGECEEGLAHGRGRATNEFDEVYVGEFEKGRISGNGVMLAAGGIRYIGDFQDGLLNGYGIASTTYKDEATDIMAEFTDGEWSNGIFVVRHGDEIFQGEKADGRLWGAITGPEIIYAGDMQDTPEDANKGSQAWGRGIALNRKDGTLYIGEFADGSPDGSGTFFMEPPKQTKPLTRKRTIKVPKGQSRAESAMQDQITEPPVQINPSGIGDPDNKNLYQFGIRFPFPDESAPHQKSGKRGKKGKKTSVTVETFKVGGVDINKTVQGTVDKKEYLEVVVFDEIEASVTLPEDFGGEHIYRGGFRQGLMHGSGTLVYGNGDALTGPWIEGMISPACIKGGEWTLVVGDCNGGVVKDGQGEASKMDTGIIYEGEFKRGEFFPEKPAIRGIVTK